MNNREMSAPLVFLDTETTGLSFDDHIWEFAAIRREQGKPDHPLHFFIEHDLAKAETLPDGFRADHDARYDPLAAISPESAARLINHITRPGNDGAKAHIVGAVPNFDTERLTRLFDLHDLTPRWHYHLIDVETLAVGALAEASFHPFDLPWDSDKVSSKLGVEPPLEGRHTAMGDAEWARAIYDKVMSSFGKAVAGMTDLDKDNPVYVAIDKIAMRVQMADYGRTMSERQRNLERVINYDVRSMLYALQSVYSRVAGERAEAEILAAGGNVKIACSEILTEIAEALAVDLRELDNEEAES